MTTLNRLKIIGRGFPRPRPAPYKPGSSEAYRLRLIRKFTKTNT